MAASLLRHAAPGDRAVLLYQPSLDFIVSFIACLYAGIIAVPAYPPRKNRSNERLQGILDDCQPKLLLTTENLLEQIQVACPAAVCLATDSIVVSSNENPLPEISSETIAFLQYTSGSTGNPKGVIVTHRSLAANLRCIQTGFGFTIDSVMVSWLPLFHDMGLVGGALSPLFVGFPAALMAPNTFLRSPIRWLEAISRFRGTCTGAPNFAWDHCVSRVTDEELQGIDLSSLQIAYNGAEPVRAETLERFAARFARYGFRYEMFFPCYGMAETTLFVTGGTPAWKPTTMEVCAESLERHVVKPLSTGEENVRRLVGCGHVHLDTRVRIADPERCEPVPPGRIGEIWVAGASVCGGYWNRPEDSRETFGAHLSTGEGPFLRTGDLGFVQDGELFVTGRLKDLIIIRGRNIYPQDVEQLVEKHLTFLGPNSCAAFAVDGPSGEELAVVVEADRTLAATARKRSTNPTEEFPEAETIAQKIRESVIEQFEVPVHTIGILSPGTFPRTSSGKVQRHACRDRLKRAIEYCAANARYLSSV